MLLNAAAAHAEAAGIRVLRAAGAEFEREVSFAGLNQLLHRLLDQASGLSAAFRRALDVALGVQEGSSPDRLLLSNAVLALLVQATTAAPVLLVVDDLPCSGLRPRPGRCRRSPAVTSWPPASPRPRSPGPASSPATCRTRCR